MRDSCAIHHHKEIAFCAKGFLKFSREIYDRLMTTGHDGEGKTNKVTECGSETAQ